MGTKYLSELHLKGFEKYKYNSIDTCILSVYVMHPFWNKCVQYCPRWVAPNLLTFSGFLLTVFNFLLLGWYDYSFDAATAKIDPIPNWLWIFVGATLFIAYTLDGIDGKQARRTGTSGPLGELFDHGLDAWSSVLIPIFMYSMFGRGTGLTPFRFYFVVWNVFFNFYFTHFEKYNTGVMFLPWGYDFTMVGCSLVLVLTGIIGPWIWRTPLPYGISPGQVFEWVLYSSAALSSQTIIAWNIYKSYRDKTGKMRPFLEAARPLYPVITLLIITTYWVVYSKNDITNLDIRILCVLTGTVFANITCRLIVAQMTDSRCDATNWLLLPVAIVSAICTTLPVTAFVELYLLYALCALTVVVHVHYGVGVVNEMCDHFKIRCFKVTQKNTK